MGVDQPLICRRFYAGNQHKEQACKSRLGLVSESWVRPQQLAERRPQRRPGTAGSRPRRFPETLPFAAPQQPASPRMTREHRQKSKSKEFTSVFPC